MRDETEIDQQWKRASALLEPDNNEDRDVATYYDKEYLRGVQDALDWVTETTDTLPIDK